MIVTLYYVICGIIGGALFGALIGLLPFLVGKYSGKPNLGMLGWKWCTGVGLAFGVTAIPVAIGFLVAIIVKETDYYPAPKVPAGTPVVYPNPAAAPVVNTHLGISCLNGPLKGQVYGVGPHGLIIGRDNDCGIRLPTTAGGISRHHCSLRWQQGVLMLTDMGSSYGTYMADGRRLPPQYPTQLAAGSRFYLANTGCMFQVVITG